MFGSKKQSDPEFAQDLAFFVPNSVCKKKSKTLGGTGASLFTSQNLSTPYTQVYTQDYRTCSSTPNS